MSTHTSNPDFQLNYPRVFYDSLRTMTHGGYSNPQAVMNPHDLPNRLSQSAWEAGLLNPNANAPCLAGSSYYTIGLGYGPEPTNLYINRKCGGLLPNYTAFGSGLPGDSTWSSGGIVTLNNNGMRPIPRNIQPTNSSCQMGW